MSNTQICQSKSLTLFYFYMWYIFSFVEVYCIFFCLCDRLLIICLQLSKTSPAPLYTWIDHWPEVLEPHEILVNSRHIIISWSDPLFFELVTIFCYCFHIVIYPWYFILCVILSCCSTYSVKYLLFSSGWTLTLKYFLVLIKNFKWQRQVWTSSL